VKFQFGDFRVVAVLAVGFVDTLESLSSNTESTEGPLANLIGHFSGLLNVVTNFDDDEKTSVVNAGLPNSATAISVRINDASNLDVRMSELHIAELLGLHEAVEGILESATGNQVALLVHHLYRGVPSDNEVFTTLEDRKTPRL
jgi:type IV secretory pathway VirB2 component (pilin)